jgi:hypothetical protein
MIANLETGKTFVSLLDVKNNYVGASELLADNFRFISPKFKAANKDEWLADFPGFHKNAPVFEDFVVEKNGNVLTRKGSKKMGFISFSLLEITEFNDEGKIQTITAKIA